MSWQPPPPLLALPTELADETVAQLLECLPHHAETVTIEGKSFRRKDQIEEQ